MPISEPRYDSEIALTHISGHLSAEDAARLATCLAEYTRCRKTPINVIIDAEHMEFMGGAARLALADLSQKPYITTLIFIATNPVTVQMLRSIEIMGNASHMRIVSTLREAHAQLSRYAVSK